MSKNELQLIIHNKATDKYYWPAVVEDIQWETAWKGTPGKLTFKCCKNPIKDSLDFHEGDEVQAVYNGTPFFYGYVFIKKRNKDSIISVTAYDQIRYLKNKAVYTFQNKTAEEIIHSIANDFQLTVGDLAVTSYVIPKYRGSNKALIDIFQDVLDMTMENEKSEEGKQYHKLYVLYDDFGSLVVKRLEDLQVPILIDNETAEDFDYESTIDKDTYNRVKLYYEDKDSGERQVWQAQNSADIKRWGVLQLCESVDPKKPTNLAEMAEKKLKYYDRVHRTLTIKGAAGDLRVRGGSSVGVQLNLSDYVLNQLLIVNRVTHTFTNGSHVMDLDVIGDVITG